MKPTDIALVATIHAKPGKEKELLALMFASREASLKEQGCHVYEVHVDPEDGGAIFMYERWADDEALGVHRKSERGRATLLALKELVDGDRMSIKKLRPASTI
jgi:quinol monooxygenase YgiN